MALPTLEKTWNFSVNNSFTGNVTTRNRNMMFQLKTDLIGLGSNPMVVKGSSDATTSGYDGPARGEMTMIPGTDLVDGDNFILDDGVNPAVTFEYDLNGGGITGDVAIVYTGIETADEIRDLTVQAINGAASLDITAARAGSSRVVMVNDQDGVVGNNAIVENVTDAGFTVTGFSGGSTTGSDLWTTNTDIVAVSGLGNPRSWIVLEMTSGAQILIDMATSSFAGTDPYRRIIVKFAPHGGFSGDPDGTAVTTSNPPTSFDEVAVLNDVVWGSNNTGTTTNVLHVLLDESGQHCHVLFCEAGNCLQMWLVSELLDPVPSGTFPSLHTSPRFFCREDNVNGNDFPTYVNLYDGEFAYWSPNRGYGSVLCALSTVGSLSDALGQRFGVPNEFTGEDEFTPIGLRNNNNVGFRGRHGRVADIWYGNPNTNTGVSFPADNTHQFAQFGDLVFPWNGTQPVVT